VRVDEIGVIEGPVKLASSYLAVREIPSGVRVWRRTTLDDNRVARFGQRLRDVPRRPIHEQNLVRTAKNPLGLAHLSGVIQAKRSHGRRLALVARSCDEFVRRGSS
jgi:hypothetical protein